MATFNEKRVPTFRKYAAEQDIIMPNLSQSLQFFLYRLLCFCFRKFPQKPKFVEYFCLIKFFAGYFQWNMFTHFQIVCSWTRYSDYKSLTDTSIFLFALLHCCFRKVPLKSEFSEIFLPLKEVSIKVCTHFPKICSWTRCNNSKCIRFTPIFLVPLLRFCLRKQFFTSKKLWWLLSVKHVHLLPENM